jgi:hypothetical protein
VNFERHTSLCTANERLKKKGVSLTEVEGGNCERR